MDLPTLGLFVQTIGAGLLTLVFLYLARGDGNRVLRAAGWAWLFLFLALSSLLLSTEVRPDYATAAYQYFKILYIVALVVTADRMEHESGLAWPLGTAAVLGIPISLGIVYFAGTRSLFFSIHMAIAAIGWFFVTAFVLRSRAPGLGKRFCSLLAIVTTLAHLAYVVVFALSAAQQDREYPFLRFTGYYDLFLEMLFGIGLTIWGMEETDRRLSTVHARAVDDTQRSRRRAQIDPLTDAYNRFFLDEIRPVLARETGGGSILLIDVDGLKTINDKEGHEEGDKAIWTVAAAVKKLIRGDDYLIRWGGDEFLVVLPGMDQEVAKKRFYMLPAKIEEVRQSPRTAPRAYRKFLAASVGVYPFSSRVPFDVAIESADRMMYERKKASKQMRGEPLERPGTSPVAAGPRRTITAATPLPRGAADSLSPLPGSKTARTMVRDTPPGGTTSRTPAAGETPLPPTRPWRKKS
jgi:diguanylate cyclase (GGDEF)-like protein